MRRTDTNRKMAMNVLAAPAAYLAILLLMFGRSFFPAYALAGGDWTFLIYPFHRFSGDIFIAEGRLPFWNDLILGGTPHLSSLNVLTLYPTELMSLPLGLPSSTFYALDLVLHLAFAGTMFAMWMRRRGLSSGAAFVGGLLWMLGSHSLTLAGAGHPHTIRCLAWLPAIFYMLERGEEEGGLVWYAGAGAGMGMCVLTAAIQFVAFAVPLCAVMVLIAGKIPVRRRLAGLGVFLAVAGGIGAVVFLPGLEYYLYSSRIVPEKNLAGLWALSPWEMLTWLVPELFGGTRGYFGPHQFRDSIDYAGLIPLFLAAAGVLAAWRANQRWLLAGAIALVLALGPVTPLGAALASLPVYGGFRNPLRWMSFFHLATCIFAATGWSILESVGGRRLAKQIGVALIAVAAPCLLLGLKSGDAAEYLSGREFVRAHIADGSVTTTEIGPAVAHAGWKAAATASVSGAAMLAAGASLSPVVFAGAPLLAIISDLLFTSSGYIRTEPLSGQEGPDPVSDWLVARRGLDPLPFRVATDEYFAVPNARMRAGIQWVSGYHGLGLGRYAVLYEEARSSPSMNLLSLMNVRFVVSASGAQEGWKPEASITMGGGGQALIYANGGAFPRAYLAREIIPCPDFSSVMEVIREPGWNPGMMPTDSLLPEGWRAGRLVTKGSIVSPKYGREEVIARVSMEGRGILVFSENWYPAWKAFVDGKRVPIIRAYGVMRALALDAGEHEVRMLYDSWLFKIGLWLSLLTAACSAIIVRLFRREWKG